MSLSLHYNGKIRDKDSYDTWEKPVLTAEWLQAGWPSPFTSGDVFLPPSQPQINPLAPELFFFNFSTPCI